MANTMVSVTPTTTSSTPLSKSNTLLILPSTGNWMEVHSAVRKGCPANKPWQAADKGEEQAQADDAEGVAAQGFAGARDAGGKSVKREGRRGHQTAHETAAGRIMAAQQQKQ